MRRLALLVLASCCDNILSTDPALTGECTITLRGNFAEASTSPAHCATVMPAPPDHTVLAFDLASTTLGSTIGISLDLGAAPTPGPYTSTAAQPWSAFAIRPVETGGCIYSAGDAAVPPGRYALDLTEIDTIAHGTLEIVQHVLAIQGTDCGDDGTETIQIVF